MLMSHRLGYISYLRTRLENCVLLSCLIIETHITLLHPALIASPYYQRTLKFISSRDQCNRLAYDIKQYSFCDFSER